MKWWEFTTKPGAVLPVGVEPPTLGQQLQHFFAKQGVYLFDVKIAGSVWLLAVKVLYRKPCRHSRTLSMAINTDKLSYMELFNQIEKFAQQEG